MIEKKHIFVVGPQATGNAFIGRKGEIQRLSTSIFDMLGVISLVGPTRIGKSSLVTKIIQNRSDYPNPLIKINMSTCESAYQFWKKLWRSLHDQLVKFGRWDNDMEEYYSEFSSLGEDDDWYSIMSDNLPNIIMTMDSKWILIIDEFDAIMKLFGNNDYYYQFLRDIYSEDYHANGIVISRRTIQSLELDNPSVSTLHGVFAQENLKGFSAEDMQEYYEALAEYDVEVSDAGKEALTEITGNMPYLCCMFANQMILDGMRESSCGQSEINAIHRKLRPKIDEYYQDLVKRLKNDGHWEAAINLCFGSPLMLNNTRLKETMMEMGCLSVRHKKDKDVYYAYSQDFMEYILMQTFDLPVWDTLMAAERKLKRLFLKVYPVLESVRLGTNESFTQEQRAIVEAQAKGLLLFWDAIESGCRKCFSRTGTAAVIDGMSLTNIIKAICYRDNWAFRFSRYFGGDESWRDYKLMQILDIRDPLAHDHYVTPEEMAACHTYCEELLRMEMYLDT